MADRLQRLAAQIAGRERAAILTGYYADLAALADQKRAILDAMTGQPVPQIRAIARLLTVNQPLLAAARDGLRELVHSARPAAGFAAYGPDGTSAPLPIPQARSPQRA